MSNFVRALFIFSIFCTATALFEQLPHGSLLKNAKINYHRQKFCILKANDQKCFTEEKPGDLEDIMKIFDVYKEVDTIPAHK